MNFDVFIPSAITQFAVPVHPSERVKLIYSSQKLLNNCYQDIKITSEDLAFTRAFL